MRAKLTQGFRLTRILVVEADSFIGEKFEQQRFPRGVHPQGVGETIAVNAHHYLRRKRNR